MPGYKALPQQFSGTAAEQVRYAEVMLRSGDPREAVRILEATLEVCAHETPELPGWLCGRLAALYRTVERYDDEVRLLERYRETQSNEDARARFDARLSKARAIADRKRRSETRALSSVRKVITGHEDGDPRARVAASHPHPDHPLLSAATRDRVRAAVLVRAHTGASAPLAEALHAVCTEAREHDVPPEHIVVALKSLWRGMTPPGLTGVLDWDALYRELLTMALTTYFETPA
jgi:hypothetical protein